MTEPVVTEIDIRTEKSEAGLRRLADALQKAGVGTDNVTGKLDEQSREFVRLTASTDAASQTRLAFERVENRLGASLAAGRISTEQYTVALDQFVAKQQAAIARTQGFGGALNAAGGGTRNLGQLAGQAGFQLQDFAVQVQGGTSALTALSQQGSQFLGIFGAGGAIAGAALAFGAIATQIALTTGAFDKLLGRSAELEKLLKIANDFIDDQAQAAERSADPYERMASNLAKARMELAKLMDAEEKRRAGDQARVQGEQEQGFFDPNQMSTVADPRIRQAQTTVDRAEVARDLAVAAEIEKGKADRDKQRDAELKKEADAAESARKRADRDADRDAEQQRRREEGLAATLEGMEREAVLAVETRAVREEELRVVEARAKVGRELTEMEEARIRTATRMRLEIEEQNRVADEARKKAERQAEQQARQDRERQEAIDDYIVSLEREAELAGLTVEKRAEELRLIEARKKAGRELTPEEESRIRNASRTKEANERMRKESEETARAIDRSFERAFDRVGDSLVDVAVKGGKAFGDLRSIAAGVAASIYADFLKLAIANPLKNFLLGGKDGGGLFGDIVSGVGKGLFGQGDQGGGMMSVVGNFGATFGGPRAGGGPVDPSKWYLVGEEGPERFVPDVPGRIVPANDTAAMLEGGMRFGKSNGGGNVTIVDRRSASAPDLQTSTDANGNTTITIRDVQNEIRKATPGIVNLSVGEVENRSARGALKIAGAA